MACEVTVKIKDKDKTMTRKTKVYKSLRADFTDDQIDDLVGKAQSEFGVDRSMMKVTVTIKLIED